MKSKESNDAKAFSHTFLRSFEEIPDLKTILTLYKEHNAWGLMLNIDAKNCNPKLIRSEEHIHNYIIQLTEIIEMKRFGDPQIVHFGDDEHVSGFSMTQLIETSLISGHFSNKTNSAYIDIFSCKPFDARTSLKFTASFFESQVFKANLLFRE